MTLYWCWYHFGSEKGATMESTTIFNTCCSRCSRLMLGHNNLVVESHIPRRIVCAQRLGSKHISQHWRVSISW